MASVRDRRAGPQRRGDHHRFDDFLFRAARPLGFLGVNLDAVGALRRHGDGEGDQFLRLRRNGAVGHRRLVEGEKALPAGGSQVAVLLQLVDVLHVVHRRVSMRWAASKPERNRPLLRQRSQGGSGNLGPKVTIYTTSCIRPVSRLFPSLCLIAGLFSTAMSEVTRILSAIEQGDPRAAQELLPLVYDELRKLAAEKMAQERRGQTLQATALVHE